MFCNTIQRGSEYQTTSDFEWWKVIWMLNSSVLECHLITEKPNPLKTEQMAAILNVRFSNGSTI